MTNIESREADEVLGQIAETLVVPREHVQLETPLADLAVDSLALVELGVDLQEEYDVIFTQEDLESLKTVGDLVQLVRTARRSGATA